MAGQGIVQSSEGGTVWFARATYLWLDNGCDGSCPQLCTADALHDSEKRDVTRHRKYNTESEGFGSLARTLGREIV